MPNIRAGDKLNVRLMRLAEPTGFPLLGKKNRAFEAILGSNSPFDEHLLILSKDKLG
jgi:hypothetical protein